ncbi:MAG TPA: hypothetical protein VGG90_01475 [Candidatus Dormibacteraeota bacterium]
MPWVAAAGVGETVTTEARRAHDVTSKSITSALAFHIRRFRLIETAPAAARPRATNARSSGGGLPGGAGITAAVRRVQLTGVQPWAGPSVRQVGRGVGEGGAVGGGVAAWVGGAVGWEVGGGVVGGGVVGGGVGVGVGGGATMV